MKFFSRLIHAIKKIIRGGKPKPKPKKQKYTHGTVYFTITAKGAKSMSEITVQTDHAPLGAAVVFKDINGLEVQPDDIPAWSSTDETVATVESSEDGLAATVTILGPGATVIEVKSVESNTGVEVIAQGTVTVQPIMPGDTAIGEITFTE